MGTTSSPCTAPSLLSGPVGSCRTPHLTARFGNTSVMLTSHSPRGLALQKCHGSKNTVQAIRSNFKLNHVLHLRFSKALCEGAAGAPTLLTPPLSPPSTAPEGCTGSLKRGPIPPASLSHTSGVLFSRLLLPKSPSGSPGLPSEGRTDLRGLKEVDAVKPGAQNHLEEAERRLKC